MSIEEQSIAHVIAESLEDSKTSNKPIIEPINAPIMEESVVPFISVPTKPVAVYVNGLLWRCPRCKNINMHNFPWTGDRRPSLELDMIGSSRMCDRCGCDYRLSAPAPN